MTEPAQAAQSQQAQAALAQLSDQFFEVAHTADPFGATQVGAPGFDALVPDPSRAGAGRDAQRIARIEERLSHIDPGLLDQAGRVNHAVLAHLAWAARSDIEHGLWEANASAGGYVSPQAVVFMSVPKALLDSAEAVDGYLQRLRGLGGYFDAVTARYSQARQDGRIPTAVGTRQAIGQIEGHVARQAHGNHRVGGHVPADVAVDLLDGLARPHRGR